MASPWYSRADEHPHGVMRMRAGETYLRAFKLTEVDPDDNTTEIGPKDYSNYADFEVEIASTPGGTPLVTASGAQIKIQGDAAVDGTLRLEIYQAQTTTLWDALQGAPGHASVFGKTTDVGDTTDPDGNRDLLFTATAAVFPA